MSSSLALKPPRVAIVYIFLGCLLLSWTSLFLAYGPAGTPTWLFRYGQCANANWPQQTGALIEGGRSLLLLLMLFYLVEIRFQSEAGSFFSYRVEWNRRSMLICRLLFAITLVYFAQDQTRHHLHGGPEDLNNYFDDNLEKHGIASFDLASARRNYIAYLPYSLVNYLIVVSPVFLVPLYAFTVDFQRLWNASRDVEKSGQCEDAVNTIVPSFRSLRRVCETMLNRYIDVLAVLSLVVHYDYWIGSMTLSTAAKLAMIVGCVLVGSAAVFVIIISKVYQRSYDFVLDALASTSDEDFEFRRRNNVLTWLRLSLQGSVGGLMFLGLAIIPIYIAVGEMVKIATP